MSRKFTFSLIASICLAFAGCADKIDEQDPVDVVKNFILLCEAGKLDKAKELVTEKNNLDYVDKFKDRNNGKDLFYIDYDYKGNDDVIELDFEYLEDTSGPTIAFVKMTSDYKKQNHKFEKVITLHMVNAKWRIHDFLFMPVKVQ